PVPVEDVEALARMLLLTAEDLDDRQVELAALAQRVGAADAAVQRHVREIRGALENGSTQARAELDAWAAHAFADVVIGPERERAFEIRSSGEANLSRAENLSALARNETLNAIWNVSAALNVTREWADNWTSSIQANDTGALREKLNSTVNATQRSLGNVTRLLKDVYDVLTDPFGGLLDPGPLSGSLLGETLADQPVTLGYDKSTGEAFVRVGREILKRGQVPGPLPDKVHASISFMSLGPHAAEVQAYWGGMGAELRDGFNRNASAPRAANWTWTNSTAAYNRTFGAAPTKVLETTPVRAHEYLVATRSPEGMRAREDANRSESPILPLLQRLLGGVSLQALPERVVGVDLASVREINLAEALLNTADGPRRNLPRAFEHVVATVVARTPRELLPPGAQSLSRLDDPAGAYMTDMQVPGGFLMEVQVGSGSRRALSAPARALLPGEAPLAPHVLDVRGWRWPNGSETLQVALQPSGFHPRLSHFDVYGLARPWTSVADAAPYHLGTVSAQRQATPLGPLQDAAGWQAGVDYFVLNRTGAPLSNWTYVTAQAVDLDGHRSAFAPPWRVPPTLLEERFSTYREGLLTNHSVVGVDRETGFINLTAGGLLGVNVDTCLGDRVEVTRFSNFPHDQIASRAARSLRVQERGLDSLFMLLRALNRSVNEIPLNLSQYDLPRAQVDLSLCPSVEELARTVGDLNATTLLGMIGYQDKPDGMPIPNDGVTVAADMRLVFGTKDLVRSLIGNQTIDLDLEELLKGTPAQVQWSTPKPTGAYHARVRFMVPGPQLGELSTKTPIDRLLSLGNLGLFSALVPGERFHLLELDNVAPDGKRTEVLRVDFDPHLLAPLDVEATAAMVDGILSLQRDPLGMLAAGNLPLSFGIAAGDTNSSREVVFQAKMDHWHTLDVYAPHASADVYALAIDGNFLGQFRTSSMLVPNALRIGGSNVPTEILVDDVRFGDAIHPPVPVAEMVKTEEAQPFAMVRWHVPEDGGAPITDANLFRLDLDTDEWEIVATAASGGVRTLVDPDSYDRPVGKRYAYAVQAVNDLD
ncbi:MAG TPA: hypothetical protein VHH36_00690, partial [Candidatus Thermoplasmatota archaeon]|nr:hypothetical protein [Candidatus Thermoplasmatota archaeon]